MLNSWAALKLQQSQFREKYIETTSLLLEYKNIFKKRLLDLKNLSRRDSRLMIRIIDFQGAALVGMSALLCS